jgi:long-chain acyl-CoA synthetase
LNIAHLIARAARVHPDRVALARGAKTVATYAQLGASCARLAAGLRAAGLAPGERVGILMSNRPEYLTVLGAAWWAGLAPVPINAKLHPRETAYILGDAGARWLFTSADHATHAHDAAREAGCVERIVVAGTDGALEALMHDATPALHDTAPDDIAWIFYTSGTTGRPKGVMITHRNLMAMTLCYFTDVDGIAPGDAIVHAAPMSHGSGLYALPHLLAAAKNVLPESGGFEPDEIFALARAHPGTAMFAAPTMVKRLVEHARHHPPDLAGLKTIVYGGGPMYLADIRDALDVMGQRFAQIYGQGESPMTITALAKPHYADRAHPRYAERLGSVGVAHSCVEVRVVDEADRALPPGETGEVIVRGDAVMRGYWGNPEATAQTLRQGWLHTGDVGTLDADGFLTLKDRSKDLIISGGSNIYPREVEEVLLAHPGVSEASVVGRVHADWGEEVVAFVVRAPGANVAPDELDALCLDHIARFKRPKQYRFVAALPKNNYGKVLKTELRALLAREGEG